MVTMVYVEVYISTKCPLEESIQVYEIKLGETDCNGTGECTMIGVLTMHGHRQWRFLESIGGEEQQFIFLIHDNVLIQHVLELIGGRMHYII